VKEQRRQEFVGKMDEMKRQVNTVVDLFDKEEHIVDNIGGR
jgi:hypothetical protein